MEDIAERIEARRPAASKRGRTRSAMPEDLHRLAIPVVVFFVTATGIAVSLATGRTINLWRGSQYGIVRRNGDAPYFWFSLLMMVLLASVALVAAVGVWISN